VGRIVSACTGAARAGAAIASYLLPRRPVAIPCQRV